MTKKGWIQTQYKYRCPKCNSILLERKYTISPKLLCEDCNEYHLEIDMKAEAIKNGTKN